MKAETFEDLKIWQEARRLTKALYTVTRQQSFKNDFGLINQIRRAAIEIASHIAAGNEKGPGQGLAQSLAAAKGSSGEVRSHLYLAMDLGYIEKDKGEALINELKDLNRMIAGFIKFLRTADNKGPKNNGAPNPGPPVK